LQSELIEKHIRQKARHRRAFFMAECFRAKFLVGVP
jgi:hypothetical protein